MTVTRKNNMYGYDRAVLIITVCQYMNFDEDAEAAVEAINGI